MRKLQIPNNWLPRSYQLPLWNALEGGCKRAVAVWHRRAGKDSVGIHWATTAALQRVGTYWHMLPTLAQGRKVVWDGITRDGRKVMDAWPDELIVHRRNDEMKLELRNGSVWQVVGSDNYNSLMGANPVGVVFSEYSLADPAAWDFIRPILVENGGWALFLYTPRGKTHGYILYRTAQQAEDWYSSRLTVDDTDAIPLDAIQAEREAGMSEEMIQQEFYCSFEAPLSGSYYAAQMMDAEKENRITNVAYDQHVPVETWWDLGVADATAIWFAQRVAKEIHMIDYYENSGEALAHYVKVLQDRGYVYGDHVLPPDVRARELQTGKSRVDALKALGLEPKILEKAGIEDGIEAVRVMLPKCWFDQTKCARGIEALRQYRKEPAPVKLWGGSDEPVYKDKPLHDWTSHGADAFRYGAMWAPIKRDWAPLEYDNRGIR